MTDVAISAEGVTKRFGDVVALDSLDLAVPAGTVFGLLGPNGAGKTTMVRILTTILRPDGGRASVLGADVVGDAHRVRTLIGLAGQYAAVDENLTGRENLRMIGRLTHLARPMAAGRADELLERFGLAGAADRTARTYSGGMRRRLDLAAALVHRPPVLFLDEPTTGLDIRSRSELWAVIAELVGEGMTLLLTTQYLEEADRLADRIAVVDNGRVMAEGTASELKAGLGSTVVEAGFADEKLAARAAEALGRFAVSGATRNGTVVHFEVDDGPRVLIAVLGELDSRGMEPATVAIREPSLDDVFLALTGHRTEAAVDEIEPGAGGPDAPTPPPRRRRVPAGGRRR
ncbi:MAG TPA: ATP-binding cassette domain-containing protein [Acidimicrobiales bacterium]|nr:ATP-binding cassette domain-containing protein [Acidimicrobiales bacterium]